MGIRTTQWIGLNGRARQLVAGKQVLLYIQETKRTYPDGREEIFGPTEIRGSDVKEEDSGAVAHGMMDDEIELSKYTFPNGTVLLERVQETHWSSGPNIFTALQFESGEWVIPSLWTEEEVAEAMGWESMAQLLEDQSAEDRPSVEL